MPFLRNAWYAAGWASELGEQPLARTLLDEPIVLYRDTAGEPVALADQCPHRFAPLSLGQVDGDRIRCPYHGLVFDKTGACAHNPHGKGARPASLSVRHYPTAVQNGLIWIWMGDTVAARDVRPPDYPFLDRADWGPLTGYLHVAANYELVTDNLMDLSHTEFLHPFIAPEGTAAAIRYRAEQDGDRIAALHAMPDQPNTPLFQLMMGDDVKRIDGHANTYWEAPSNMLLEAYAIALDTGDGRRADLPTVHLLTPESETGTHYFWGVARNAAVGDTRVDEMLFAGISHAFEQEDEPMIRAVQARMRGRSLFDLSPALLPMDEAAVRVRRTLAKRIAAEQAAGQALAAAAIVAE